MTLRYSLRELEVFVAIANHGTVTAAANALAMTQSAASQALATLEHNLATPLFDRIGRRLVLSAKGRQLLPKARALLDDAVQLNQSLQQVDDVPILIAASTTIANYLLPPAIATYLRQYPHAPLQLSVGNTAEIIEQVADFKVDFGFIEGPCHHPELTVQPWRDDELVIFCAPETAKAWPNGLTLAELQQQTWVLRETGSGTRNECERLLLPTLGQFRQVLELGHSEAIKRTVASGFGISCLSRHVIADALSRGDVVQLATPLPMLTRPLYLIRHHARLSHEATSRFLACCSPVHHKSHAVGNTHETMPVHR